MRGWSDWPASTPQTARCGILPRELSQVSMCCWRGALMALTRALNEGGASSIPRATSGNSRVPVGSCGFGNVWSGVPVDCRQPHAGQLHRAFCPALAADCLARPDVCSAPRILKAIPPGEIANVVDISGGAWARPPPNADREQVMGLQTNVDPLLISAGGEAWAVALVRSRLWVMLAVFAMTHAERFTTVSSRRTSSRSCRRSTPSTAALLSCVRGLLRR